MSDYLPKEVWNDILTRLSIKTLLQMRSVSKLFLSLISNPSFISTHLTKIEQNHTCFLRYMSENGTHKREHFLLMNESIPTTFDQNEIVGLDFPFKSRSSCHFRIVGSCNGVICLSDDHGSYAYGIILWNPSIKRFVRLPKPRVCRKIHGSYMFVLGFGFDFKSNDYKVVRLAYLKGRNGKDLIPPEVEIYSVSSGVWRSFNTGAPPYGIYGYTWTQAFVNNSVHWNGFDPCVPKGSEKLGLIVSFDLTNEMFGKVKLPECLEQSGWDLSVRVIKGMLGVLQNGLYGSRTSCSVWVMEKYGVVESWRKLYNVDLKGPLKKLIGFVDNQQVLGSTVRGKLISYDPITCGFRSLGIRGSVDAYYMDNYMESLVLLDSERVESDIIICGGGEEDEEEEEEEKEAFKWPIVTNDEFDWIA